MKKISSLVIGILSMTNFYCQDLTDALRYSDENISGTARFAAMSGAFGALGGDLSAIGINPAGSSIFARSYASLSFLYADTQNDATFFNNTRNDNTSKFDLNQGGAAFIFTNNNENSSWKKLALAVNYDKTSDYKDSWYTTGNNTRSIDQYFLAFAEGLRLDEISAFPDEDLSDAYTDIGESFGYANQQAFLGYESYIIDPVENSDDNSNYISNVSPGTFNQNFSYLSSGYNGKFSINASTQYGEKLYLGINLNSYFINFERNTYLFETNSNANSFVTDIDFRNYLHSTGNGFSFQFGGIYKITNELRAGLSYATPTWYTIFEETSQYINTSVDDGTEEFVQIINPATINVFPEYRLRTPSNLTASLAYVFGEQGLISFDYGRKDYSNIEFRPKGDAVFAAQNEVISNTLKSASSYKIGGEYRAKAWSFRGGYRFEESPYENDNFYGNLSGYSVGLGYNFGNFKFDLAFSDYQREYNYQLYQIGLTNAANIDSSRKTIFLTLGFSL